MKFLWHDIAWADYVEWQKDKKKLKRINNLLEDIDRNGYNCIGKPEPLKGNYSGWWSVRIDEKNRLIFKIENEVIEIAQKALRQMVGGFFNVILIYKLPALARLLAKIFSTASKTRFLSSSSSLRRAALNAAFSMAFEMSEPLMPSNFFASSSKSRLLGTSGGVYMRQSFCRQISSGRENFMWTEILRMKAASKFSIKFVAKMIKSWNSFMSMSITERV